MTAAVAVTEQLQQLHELRLHVLRAIATQELYTTRLVNTLSSEAADRTKAIGLRGQLAELMARAGSASEKSDAARRAAAERRSAVAALAEDDRLMERNFKRTWRNPTAAPPPASPAARVRSCLTPTC